MILFTKGTELTIFGLLKILMMFSINLNLKTFRLLNCLHMIFLHCIYAILGFANAKHKGFVTFSDAVSAMVAAGFPDFSVIDGQNAYTRSEYEHKYNIQPVSIN